MADRLRTHLGNPTQTFTALEQMLQSLLQRSSSSNSGSTSSTGHAGEGGGVNTADTHQPTMLLLEFMHALEQNVSNAHEGLWVRPQPPGSAAAFFSANQKVSSGKSSMRCLPPVSFVCSCCDLPQVEFRRLCGTVFACVHLFESLIS